MHRWAACPGSVRLCAGLPNRSTSYAAQGTLAHELAANLIRVGKLGAEIGETRNVEGYEITVTEEMIEAVNEYLSWGASVEGPGSVSLVEHRFDLSKVHPGCFGTADAVIYRPVERL